MKQIVEHIYFYGKQEHIHGLIREYVDSGDLALVQKEDGCIQFEFYYAAAETGKAVLLERWRCNTALEAHHETAMMKKLLDLIKKYEFELKAETFCI